MDANLVLAPDAAQTLGYAVTTIGVVLAASIALWLTNASARLSRL